MKQLMYTIYDEKAEVFLPPFFVPTEGIAGRAFRDCINSGDHQFSKHPGDYTLFYLAEFNQDTGEFPHQDKKMLGNGVEFIDTPAGTNSNDSPNSPILPDKNSGDSA